MKLRFLGFSILLLAVAMFAVACGASSDSDKAASSLGKITPSETIYALDDLLEIGFKKDKTFDVEGLTGAVSAYYGFWGVDPYARKEYEARFYPSHSDAVEFGVVFADERTGPDAVIKAEETMWDEGTKDARSCARISSNGNCQLSKYGDYVIYGNMILICEGRDSSTSLEECGALLSALVPGLGVNAG